MNRVLRTLPEEMVDVLVEGEGIIGAGVAHILADEPGWTDAKRDAQVSQDLRTLAGGKPCRQDTPRR